jgi:S-DNA-T family DNA segregation ATPase FtsK/SpoIIIE
MSTVPFRSVPSAYRLPAGQFYTVYRSLADRPHLLIAGATGSGKSVVINGIITTMIMNASPFRCQFVLIDPKRVELAQYRSLPHVARYASEPGDMIAALEWSLTETDRRFRLMQSAGVKEYDGPDMYVIIDELADLMTTNKKSALPLLQRLAQIGRAARVHLIAASQNVLAITIPTVLKCNFSSILGLRTATRAQSRYLVDAEGCERLPDPKKEGVGYGFLRDGADLERLILYKYDDGITASLISWWTSPACIAS